MQKYETDWYYYTFCALHVYWTLSPQSFKIEVQVFDTSQSNDSFVVLTCSSFDFEQCRMAEK